MVPRRLYAVLASVALLASALVAAAAGAEAQEPPAIRAGYGEADATWHVGAGSGQYTHKWPEDCQDPQACNPTSKPTDPHNHAWTQQNSYGVQSRLSYRSIVVEDAEGDQVAFVKSDSYLAQDYLARRVGQILEDAGSKVSYDEIFHMASHNHSSPYYTTPSWGPWVFQDVMDLRAFEYHARAMAQAILNAEAQLQDAQMGATTVEHKLFKGMIGRRTVADDGTPAGYPLDFGDFGLSVVRFDSLDTGKPIATLINWGQHPEGLDPYNLITGDFIAPLERFVERATGAPLVFGQGDVGSAEAGPGHPELIPEGIPRRWSHAGHAQGERGAFLLAQDVVKAFDQISDGSPLVPFDSAFDVAAGNAWVPGPLSHPFPTVTNCKSESTLEGNPAPPIGVPTCERALENDENNMFWETLKAHGFPIPDHYSAPGFIALEENNRLHLQAFKLGEVILMSCACEAQVDLILNLESRTDEVEGNIWHGYDWTTRLDCTQAAPPDGDWTCVRPADDPSAPGSTFSSPLTFTDARYERMLAEIHNDAAGWDDPENAATAESEPSDPKAIFGNFTHTELPAELGYALPIGVGHASDYNGYTVSYREYMSYDHYRKSLTAYGPHTADYMNTTLLELARELNDGDDDDTFDYRSYDEPRHEADEQRQEASARMLGALTEQAYDSWRASLPDDVGPAEGVAEPENIQRFSAATFSWRGGSNAVDNPTVKVQRLVDGAWTDFADQSGEVQTMLEFPSGLNAFFDTYSGGQAWIWTANFEAFDAFPAEIGSTPEGEYRFVVDGLIRQDGQDVSYHLESDPFIVSPWNGVQVNDLRVEPDGSVSFTTDSTYPQTYDSVVPYVAVEMETETGDGEIPGPERKQFCMTCSFRPWATSGTVTSATVTVTRANGTIELVPATLVDGRWVAPVALLPGDSAFVDAGSVVDNYGEVNAAPTASVTAQ